jgi:hypothetical protein
VNLQVIGVTPSGCITLPLTAPGWHIDTSMVVLFVEVTTIPCRSSVEKLVA